MEKSVTQRIIYYSKKLLALKIIRIQLQQLQRKMKESGFQFSVDEAFKLQFEQVEKCYAKISVQCRDLMYPLLQNHDFGYREIEHYRINEEDLRKGYIVLEEESEERYVLFLFDYKCANHNIKEGELLPFNKVAPILGNYKSMVSNSKSLLAIPSVHKMLSNSVTKLNNDA